MQKNRTSWLMIPQEVDEKEANKLSSYSEVEAGVEYAIFSGLVATIFPVLEASETCVLVNGK